MKHKQELILNRKRNAFTLIELLVVIAVIGLLVSIVFVNLKNVREKAVDAVKKHNLSQIQVALESYYADTGAYYPWAKDQEPPGWSFENDWDNYLDTPCEDTCTSPKKWCRDYSNSDTDRFMDQLVQAGYFTKKNMNHMVGADINQKDMFQIRYRYTCDLQEYGLSVTLSDGNTYTLSN